MKEIYKQILNKSIPYYEEARKGDIEHINWLFNIIPKYINKTEIDFDILMPLVILHDIGYSKVPKNSNPYNLDIRELHSKEGAKISEKILISLKYPKSKIKEIKRLILKHDNWAFGDDFSDEPALRIFNNFDFMWMASEKGFDIVRRFMKKTPKEFYKQIKDFEKTNKKQGRKWFNKKIQELYNNLMNSRKN